MFRIKILRLYICLIITGLLLVGCASQGNLQDNKPARMSNSLSWVMGSDTYKECVLQTYLNAGDRLEWLCKGKQNGSWCVIFDTDETLLNNSLYQAELEASGGSYNEESWGKWCARMEATALPGVVDFCHQVQDRGGLVIIISNRRGNLMEATIGNLKKENIPFNACILKGGPYSSDDDKTIRRAKVRNGSVDWGSGAAVTNPPGDDFPPLEILMLCGDQTHDLYDPAELTYQDVKKRFNRELVIIPNPMYGFPPVYYDRKDDKILTEQEAADSSAK